MNPIDALADRFIAAIEAADVETVTSIYAPDVRVWHNFDMVEQTREQNVRQIQWFATRLQGMRYDDIRRTVLEDGFVQQHVLRGTAPNGTEIAVHAMLRVWCDGSTITRLDEYLDPAQAAALAG
jgi:uncharacterized protein